MRTGIRPRVNEAREFLEIAKDFKDPKEIIREAISNSWDAGASKISIKFDAQSVSGSRKKSISVRISDDGYGMSSDSRPEIGSSEIEGFFNLGDSGKGGSQIGSKGHGTKIYYKSAGFTVTTHKDGKQIIAKPECDPWAALKAGQVPTYSYEEKESTEGKGTTVEIQGFEAKLKEFSDVSELIEYVKWYTAAGSFRNYFEEDRKIDVELKALDSATPVRIDFGFEFPEETSDLSNGTASICKVFGPETLKAGSTSDGRVVEVQIIGAILGENNRTVVPHTYDNMGLWLTKDYLRIERKNNVLEKAFGGQYWYRNFLIFANSQQFDLTANRNDIRISNDEYDMAIDAIREWCEAVAKDSYTKEFFAAKKAEDDEKKSERQKKDEKDKQDRTIKAREDRVNKYLGRPHRDFPGVSNGPVKEPINEAETALLLQAMISSGHSGIDFRIGEYCTARGVDLIVERDDKGFAQKLWVELVHTLSQLGAWAHNPEGYNAIVCYDLGGVPQKFSLFDGREATLSKKASAGRYVLTAGNDTFEVYVLRHILDGTDTPFSE